MFIVICALFVLQTEVIYKGWICLAGGWRWKVLTAISRTPAVQIFTSLHLLGGDVIKFCLGCLVMIRGWMSAVEEKFSWGKLIYYWVRTIFWAKKRMNERFAQLFPTYTNVRSSGSETRWRFLYTWCFVCHFQITAQVCTDHFVDLIIPLWFLIVYL